MIFVTGAPRSGTSLVCQVLAAHGINFGGPLVGPGRANPRGFFEHGLVRDQVLKPILTSIGADPRGQKPLPPRRWEPTDGEVARFRHDVLAALGTAEAYKDAPKILLLWPLFHAAFPEARWVFVYRRAADVARSCNRTSFMRAYQTEAAWGTYVLEIATRMAAVGPVVGQIPVWPDPNDPRSFRGMVKALGLEWDPAAVEEVCDPSIWGRR